MRDFLTQATDPRKRSLFALALLLGTVFASGSASVHARSPLSFQEPAKQNAPATEERILTEAERANILNQVDVVLAQVSQLRGLPVKRPVKKGFKSRAEVKALLEKYLAEEKSETALEGERKTLLKLRLIPKDFPYKQFLLDFLSQQIAGFYDFRTREMNLIDSEPIEYQLPILSHELDHALQDQHFKLLPFANSVDHNDDRLEARRAVIEGEATALMMDLALKPLGRDITQLPVPLSTLIEESSKLDERYTKLLQTAPRAIQKSLLFAYLEGSLFFQEFRRRHAWSDANQLFLDPPQSTEQILHPEKYWSQREDPIDVKLTSACEKLLKPRWKKVYWNTLGEFSAFLTLSEFLPSDQAKKASQGWAGDQYQLYENASGDRLFLLASVWDTEKDAKEFLDGYANLLAKKYSDAHTLASTDENARSWQTKEGLVWLERIANRVFVIEGSTANEIAALRRALKKSKMTAPARHPKRHGN